MEKEQVFAEQNQQKQINILLITVFLAYVGQMTLNPVIAPLSREIGLAEWQVGVMISGAAVMVVLTSQFWGRRSQSWGRKPVLVAAMLIATVAMMLFTMLSAFGMRGVLTGTALFILFVLTRGILFGSALAAVIPTAQAYISDVTTTKEERIQGMAKIGAAQGMASVIGPLIGGLLGGISLMISITAVPILLFVGLGLIIFKLRREERTELIPDPPHISPFDTRIWPFLVAGFGMFTALGFVQVTAGFIVQDRFALDANSTGLVTGGAMLAAGVGMVISQAVIVPRSGWKPATLLRVGVLVSIVGYITFLMDGGIPLLIAAIGLIGLGLGIAVPGYIAGPTLLMDRAEQGGLAGLIGATNGLTFVIAPTASTALYTISSSLSVVAGIIILVFVFGFVLIHPRFHKLSS